jgi:two-component system KDP operon response regulator KdpE
MTARRAPPTLRLVTSAEKPLPQVKVALLAHELIGALVALVLRHVDAECRPISSQAELVSLGERWSPDLVIADLDKFEHAPEWARQKMDGRLGLPCLGLLRERDTETKLDAFERGATDVIEIPFTPDEIVVRTIATLMRDGKDKPEIRRRLVVGRFEMDLHEPGVRLNDQLVKLTLLEQTLLYLFLASPGKVLRREDILADIWGSQSAVTSNVIDRHIRDLRVKLQERWKEPRFIATEPGLGYRFVGDGGPSREVIA